MRWYINALIENGFDKDKTRSLGAGFCLKNLEGLVLFFFFDTFCL